MLRSVFGDQQCLGQCLGVNHSQVSVWGSTIIRSVRGSTMLLSAFGVNYALVSVWGQLCSGQCLGSTMLRSVFGNQQYSGQCLGVNYAQVSVCGQPCSCQRLGSTMLWSAFGVNYAQVGVWGSTMLRSVFGGQLYSGQNYKCFDYFEKKHIIL